MLQPKPYMNNFRLRKSAIGTERRRNMSKIMLENSANFPLPVEFSDIDNAFNEWVAKLDAIYDGKRLPIFKLFSNQRIGEYSQSWQHLDEVGNLLMNFFLVTRDNNPKQGQNQGGNFNIPGNRKYPMFIKPSLQENGELMYEMYSMHQPYSVDFSYSLTLITNKYELLNEVNQKIHDEFKAMEVYIAPNGHYMPMKLEDVADESEYAIDDRKYYSQTYKITLWGYIIREEDYEVTTLPSRLVDRILGDNPKEKKKDKAVIKVEEYDDWELECPTDEYDRYGNKTIKLEINFPPCAFRTSFEIDTTLAVTDIKTNNIYDFVMKINNEFVNFEDEINIEDGDTIYIEIERNHIGKDSTITIIGEGTEIVDFEQNRESILDETPVEEDIIINAKEKEENI